MLKKMRGISTEAGGNAYMIYSNEATASKGDVWCAVLATNGHQT